MKDDRAAQNAEVIARVMEAVQPDHAEGDEPKRRLPLKHCRAISEGQTKRHQRQRKERAAAVAVMREIGAAQPGPFALARGQSNGRRAALVELLSGGHWLTVTEIMKALGCPRGSASGFAVNGTKAGWLARRHRDTPGGPVFEYRAVQPIGETGMGPNGVPPNPSSPLSPRASTERVR